MTAQNKSAPATRLREVGQVLKGQATEDGDGVRLTRVIGGHARAGGYFTTGHTSLAGRLVRHRTMAVIPR